VKVSVVGLAGQLWGIVGLLRLYCCGMTMFPLEIESAVRSVVTPEWGAGCMPASLLDPLRAGGRGLVLPRCLCALQEYAVEIEILWHGIVCGGVKVGTMF
jgi:hypothetical protein